MYTGVKDFIQEFKEPFDRQGKATTKAKKNLEDRGVKRPSKSDIDTEVLAVFEEWDHKRQRGEDYQVKLCQKEVEKNPDAILGTYSKYDPANPPTRDLCLLEPNSVYLEKYLFSDRYKLHGYADRIDTSKGIINITDNKVVDKIYRSGSFKTDKGFMVDVKPMFPPLQGLKQNNYNDFVLQLSLYMYLAWENNKNLKVGKLFIRHITMNDNDKVTGDELIEVPYMKDEVKKMLRFRLENQ